MSYSIVSFVFPARLKQPPSSFQNWILKMGFGSLGGHCTTVEGLLEEVSVQVCLWVSRMCACSACVCEGGDVCAA